MTVYEILLSEMKTPNFLHLIKSGIIPITIMDYKMYYEMYLSERKKGAGKMQSISNVSSEFSCSERTVRNAIEVMNR